MNNSLIEVESTLTDRYQTTVPETVRKALHLAKRDKIHYAIQGNGGVLITRAESRQEDPIVESFLTFIAKDIQKHPENVMSLNSDLHKRIQGLVAGVEFDLNKPLFDEDE
ncbi:MAG: type II toxin-antitoxin system PrlF family antitoxin [Legionellales bacterium]